MTEELSPFVEEITAVAGEICGHVCEAYGEGHPVCQRAKGHAGAKIAIDAHFFFDGETFVLFSEICPQPES